jgi:hypothetical protein
MTQVTHADALFEPVATSVDQPPARQAGTYRIVKAGTDRDRRA